MGFSVKNKPSPEIIAILFFTSLYLLFPTINNSADALGYSAIPEIGVHHLLYDKLASFCLYSICDNQPEKALHLLQAINGLFAGATLLLASKFLRNSGVSGPIYIWLILIGSTFGWIRFATENE
ncbi:MAG: hypothetical protein KG003_01835, partial [Bacteroidetes bacterium]|nr:hypothetical protein [Bacteroidota bacterium]